VLYVFFVLSLERRPVLHVNVTAHPYAAWAAQQMIEAVAPDVVASASFVTAIGSSALRSTSASPAWGSSSSGSRRARLGRTASPTASWDGPTRAARSRHRLGERHLLRLVRDYVRFYNDDRPHMALDGDAPAGRAAEGPELGEVVALPRVGGLHHRYSRAA
jgi:putative transposase